MNTTTFRPQQDLSFETVAPGIQFGFLRRHDGGAGLTVLVRMEEGGGRAAPTTPAARRRTWSRGGFGSASGCSRQATY